MPAGCESGPPFLFRFAVAALNNPEKPSDTSPDAPQPLSLTEAIVPIAALIGLIGLSYFLFGDAGAGGPNQVALVIATMIAVAIARRRGHGLKSLSDAAVASVGTGIGAIFILFGVGALIGTWAMSGTLAAMVYYGLQLLSPNYFYVTVAAICAIVSFSLGSSWTVVGTIGVGFMGIAASMDLNPAITAAAIISGAYFGDTSSPLSDSANLAAAAADVDLYKHVKVAIFTSALSLAIALAVFSLFGQSGQFDAGAKLAQIERSFHISLWLFLPLVVVIGLAAFKVPPFTSIFIGALTGGVLAVCVAPERVVDFAHRVGNADLPAWLAMIKGVWLALASGYVANTGYPPLDMLATRGGMASMLSTVWLIITALAFGGVIERAGVLERLITPLTQKLRSAGSVVATTVGAVVATNIATADQYIAIVLPGRMLKKAFEKMSLAPVMLSRTIGAAGTPTSALIPWNSCGAYMSATLGVATFSYLPYAVFNFASPLIAVALGFLWVQKSADDPPAMASPASR